MIPTRVRVASLVPSLTETLVDLGLPLGDEIVAVTSFCVHPSEARKKARVVGGTKNPKIDRLVELAPDLVVVNFEENRLEDVRALESAGLRMHVTEIRTVRDAEDAVRELGRVVGRDEAGDAIAESIARERVALESRLAGDPLRVFVPIWKEPWMGFNADTFAHDVLRLAGATNVLASKAARYPETTPEEALDLGAEAALLPSEPWKFAAADADEMSKRGFRGAALLDGEALTWYGSRLSWGLGEVARVVADARRAVEPLR